MPPDVRAKPTFGQTQQGHPELNLTDPPLKKHLSELQPQAAGVGQLKGLARELGIGLDGCLEKVHGVCALSGRRGLSRCMVQRVEIQFGTKGLKESRPTVGQEPAQLAQLIVLVPTAQADIVYRIESSPAFKC